MKKLSIIAAFLLVTATVTWAMAGQERMGLDGRGHMDSTVMAALELTPEQTTKIQALHESTSQKITPIKAQLVTKRAEMKVLWTQPSLDADKIKATQKEIQALRTQIREIQTDMRIAFRSLLTPEQTSKLLAMGFGKGGRHKKGAGYGQGAGTGTGKIPRAGGWTGCRLPKKRQLKILNGTNP